MLPFAADVDVGVGVEVPVEDEVGLLLESKDLLGLDFFLLFGGILRR